MRYRKLSSSGDYVFGQGSAEFLVDSPEAVAQSVQTRLGLFTGEWFLDSSEGTPWGSEILGHNQPFYDAAIKQRILDTNGVNEISDYASYRDGATRKLSIYAIISTDYGTATVSATL